MTNYTQGFYPWVLKGRGINKVWGLQADYSFLPAVGAPLTCSCLVPSGGLKGWDLTGDWCATCKGCIRSVRIQAAEACTGPQEVCYSGLVYPRGSDMEVWQSLSRTEGT